MKLENVFFGLILMTSHSTMPKYTHKYKYWAIIAADTWDTWVCIEPTPELYF